MWFEWTGEQETQDKNSMKFERDAANRKHIARHNVTPEEAEEAILIEPLEASTDTPNGAARSAL